jgi:hypothetical protein
LLSVRSVTAGSASSAFEEDGDLGLGDRRERALAERPHDPRSRRPAALAWLRRDGREQVAIDRGRRRLRADHVLKVLEPALAASANVAARSTFAANKDASHASIAALIATIAAVSSSVPAGTPPRRRRHRPAPSGSTHAGPSRPGGTDLWPQPADQGPNGYQTSLIEPAQPVAIDGVEPQSP